MTRMRIVFGCAHRLRRSMVRVPVSLVLVRALVRALELVSWGLCPGHPWLVA
jgi:hypothetical protein